MNPNISPSSRICVVFTAAILLLAPMARCQTQSELTHGFSEKILGPVPDPVNMTRTADKKHVVYVMSLAGKNYVLLNGQPLFPAFDANSIFVQNTFGMSNDGKRTGYAIGKEDPTNPCDTCSPQGKWHAVIDGQSGPEYDLISRIVFSPDGTHVAYGAIDRKKQQEGEKDHWVMVIDGKETPLPYEAISRDSPVFTPNSKQLVYIAKKGEKTVVVVDEKEGPAYDKIKQSIPVFSSNGTHMAYIARNYGESGETVILDGKPGPGFDNIPERSLVFSPDDQHLAYGGQTGGIVPGDSSTWSVVVDGKPGPQYDQVDKIVFSRDSKHVAYKAKKHDKWLLVVDGKPGPECEDITEGFPVFSPDSSRIAYGFKTGGTWKIMVHVFESAAGKDDYPSGVIGGEYQGAGMITFSPDGKRLAFGGIIERKRTIVVDGKPLGLEHDMIANIVFSPDGKRLGYEAGTIMPDKDDKWVVVVDGRTLDFPVPVRSSVLFSSDSKHFAYLSMKNDMQQIIIDGKAGPRYKTVCQLLASDDNGFESIVVGDNLCQMVWKP